MARISRSLRRDRFNLTRDRSNLTRDCSNLASFAARRTHTMRGRRRDRRDRACVASRRQRPTIGIRSPANARLTTLLHRHLYRRSAPCTDVTARGTGTRQECRGFCEREGARARDDSRVRVQGGAYGTTAIVEPVVFRCSVSSTVTVTGNCACPKYVCVTVNVPTAPPFVSMTSLAPPPAAESP